MKLLFYMKGLVKRHRNKPYVLKYFPLFSYKNVQCLSAILKLDKTFQFEEKRLYKTQYSREPMNLQ